MSNLKIYCLCINDGLLDKVKSLNYIPVALGKGDYQRGWLRDNTGTNISHKNKYYGEYTFHYWLWQNDFDIFNGNDWVGFCTYRRFWMNEKIVSNSEIPFKDKILNRVPKIWNDYDVILANKISKVNRFVALNAQVNASNYGYHSLNKYKKIDSLIINETELRHEMRDKLSDVFYLAKILKNKYKIKNLIVTRGRNGAFLIEYNKNKIVNCPAFSDKVIDKVGAGDTMLAIISLCLTLKIPSDLSLFLGSLAGAISVESMGSSVTLNKKSLLRKIEFILK